MKPELFSTKSFDERCVYPCSSFTRPSFLVSAGLRWSRQRGWQLLDQPANHLLASGKVVILRRQVVIMTIDILVVDPQVDDSQDSPSAIRRPCHHDGSLLLKQRERRLADGNGTCVLHVENMR